ncbi:MAG: DUF4129 domain-containing protein, partial [Prochlorococcus sp.]
QEALLWQLFGRDYRQWQGALLVVSTLLLLAAGLLVLQRLRPDQRHPLRRDLDRCLDQLGITPDPGQSLEACLQQIQQRRPELAAPLQQLAQSYARQRFDPDADAASRRQWQISLQTLRRVRIPRDEKT